MLCQGEEQGLLFAMVEVSGFMNCIAIDSVVVIQGSLHIVHEGPPNKAYPP